METREIIKGLIYLVESVFIAVLLVAFIVGVGVLFQKPCPAVEKPSVLEKEGYIGPLPVLGEHTKEA